MEEGWVRKPEEDSPALSNSSSRKTITTNQDGSQGSEGKFVVDDEVLLRDNNYLLEMHGYDPACWEVINSKHSFWDTQIKGGSVKAMYSSRITVKPKPFDITSDDIVQIFNNLDRKYSKPKVQINEDYLSGDKLLLIDISDLHLNLQATMLTTGNEYNCDIAEKLFFYVINDVISRTKKYSFNKIIFTIGGDFLNTDNLQNGTTKGTPQSVCTHMFDAYERACEMTIKAIDILKELAPIVEVIYIASNHDLVSSWKLAHFLKAWFRNDNRVKVDTSPLPRKYVKFGNTLFVFAHDGDLKRLPKLIPDEAREYWSSISFTEVMLQHLHSEQILMEENNMRIQRLPTISAKSKWSNDNDYGSKRQCKSFIYDMNDGITDVLYTPVKGV